MSRKVGIYIRVSTQEQAESGISIEIQRSLLYKFCELHGWEVHKEYVDAAKSAATIERKALQELLEDCDLLPCSRKRASTGSLGRLGSVQHKATLPAGRVTTPLTAGCTHGLAQTYIKLSEYKKLTTSNLPNSSPPSGRALLATGGKMEK